MFLVSDEYAQRVKRIRGFLTEDNCPIAVLLAAAHFEWTASRAILALGTTPTAELRRNMAHCHGLAAYAKLWASEVTSGRPIGPLESTVQNWQSFQEHFQLRHLLIHGRESCSLQYARPRVDSVLRAAHDIRAACDAEGVNLYSRLRTRRKPRKTR